MKLIMLWLIALLASPAVLLAQSEPKSQPPASAPKPEGQGRTALSRLQISNRVYVMDDAPDFELTNSNGRQVRLSYFRGRRVMLTFADRRELLVPLRAASDSLGRMGVILVGVCHDSPQSLRSLAARDSLPFELLSDPSGEIAAIYGSYDFLTSSILPGYVLVGVKGLVRMVLVGQALPPDALIELTRYTLSGL